MARPTFGWKGLRQLLCEVRVSDAVCSQGMGPSVASIGRCPRMQSQQLRIVSKETGPQALGGADADGAAVCEGGCGTPELARAMANRQGEGQWIEAIAILNLYARCQQGGLDRCFIDHKGIVEIEEDRRCLHPLPLQSASTT